MKQVISTVRVEFGAGSRCNNEKRRDIFPGGLAGGYKMKW